MNQSKEMAKLAYTALSDKKGERYPDHRYLRRVCTCRLFPIVNGNSDSQVNALVDNVEEELHKAGYSLVQREGNASGRWVLLDFGDIIVHVFDRENRQFYNLERIWKDGHHVSVEDLEA